MKNKFLLISLLFASFITNNSSSINETPVSIKSRIKNQNEFKGQSLDIYICADYIHEDFEAEFEELYGCEITIHTYDTNETMYNQFTLQPEGTYDLICTSDYMIQKMIREDLVQKFDVAESCPTYNTYVSQEARSKLINLKADTDNDGKKDTSLDGRDIAS